MDRFLLVEGLESRMSGLTWSLECLSIDWDQVKKLEFKTYTTLYHRFHHRFWIDLNRNLTHLVELKIYI